MFICLNKVPRYILLFREIIKLTDETDELNLLNKAKEKLEEIGDLINKKKRESEQIFRIIQIQSSLDGEGFVRKNKNK